MDHQAGQEPTSALRVALGIGLATLILAGFCYTIFWWYQRGWCWHRPDFVFSLYRTRGPGSVAVELVPPFSISGSLSATGSSYAPFHNRGL